MFTKINVTGIIFDHFKTLSSIDGKILFTDIFCFIVFPLFLGGFLTCLNINISNSAANLVITILSIFVGLLLNLLLITYDISTKEELGTVKNNLLKETSTNILFCILIGFVLISFTILILIIDFQNYNQIILYVVLIIKGFMNSLIIMFLLTLLMIVKRIDSLITTNS